MDRNNLFTNPGSTTLTSLSARRAWIEITTPTRVPIGCVSLSARRAWIEINTSCSVEKLWAVALRKESVDRNYSHAGKLFDLLKSLSARRAWIEISWWTTLTLPYRSLSARRAWIEIAGVRP